MQFNILCMRSFTWKARVKSKSWDWKLESFYKIEPGREQLRLEIDQSLFTIYFECPIPILMGKFYPIWDTSKFPLILL